jgi:starch synthase
VVRQTGGLADTVTDVSAGQGTGFVFDAPQPQALIEAVERAVKKWKARRQWRQIQKRAMSRDYCWKKAAKRYLQVYESAGRAQGERR